MKLTESKLRTIIRNEIMNMNEDDQFDAITFKFTSSADVKDAAKALRKKRFQVVEYTDGSIEVHYKTDSQRNKIKGIVDRLPFKSKQIKNKYE